MFKTKVVYFIIQFIDLNIISYFQNVDVLLNGVIKQKNCSKPNYMLVGKFIKD